jgi:hypothetical protein
MQHNVYQVVKKWRWFSHRIVDPHGEKRYGTVITCIVGAIVGACCERCRQESGRAGILCQFTGISDDMLVIPDKVVALGSLKNEHGDLEMCHRKLRVGKAGQTCWNCIVSYERDG